MYQAFDSTNNWYYHWKQGIQSFRCMAWRLDSYNHNNFRYLQIH